MNDPSELIKQSDSICETATPGPWWLADGELDGSVTCKHPKSGDTFCLGWLEYDYDNQFIVAARTLLPQLAKALVELQTQLSDVVCKKIEDMSESELRHLCLLNDTTLEESAARTRYVVKAAIRQFDLENKIKDLTRELDDARTKIVEIEGIKESERPPS